MTKTTLLFSTLLAGLLPTFATQAQDNGATWVSSSGSLHYDGSTGQLHIPALTMRASRFEPFTLLFDVVLRHNGDETFRVVSSRGVQPDEECTRAEVLAAAPQVHLNMTVTEAEALIGCKAVINVRETDLALGRRVEASWRGQDGAPNPGATDYAITNYNFSGYSAIWVPVSGGISTPSGVPALGFAAGGPAIVLSLREGVVESYTYVNAASSTLCESTGLQAGFSALQEGESLAQIDAKLGCAGTLLQTTVSAGQSSEQVSWQSRSAPIIPSIPAELHHQSIKATFENGAMTLATKVTSTVQYLPSPCSVEQIVAMADAIQAGMSEEALRALSTCPAASVNSSETATSSTASYHWSSQNKPESIYVTVNRSLTVSLQDGKVSEAVLRRH